VPRGWVFGQCSQFAICQKTIIKKKECSLSNLKNRKIKQFRFNRKKQQKTSYNADMMEFKQKQGLQNQDFMFFNHMPFPALLPRLK